MPTKHLAIFKQPFLDLILDGKKTIESRFAKVYCAPHGVVQEGDLILLKESGGFVIGEFRAGKIESYKDLTPEEINKLRRYSNEICADADPEFWEKRSDKQYATMIWIIDPIRYIKPYPFPKKDRRGWVVIEKDPPQQSMFKED